MALLKSYTKQPADRLDYDFDYAIWLNADDEILSAEFTIDSLDDVAPQTPMTADSQVVAATFTKVWLVGGQAGETYKVSCTVTTARGRVKQDEIKIRLKEY